MYIYIYIALVYDSGCLWHKSRVGGGPTPMNFLQNFLPSSAQNLAQEFMANFPPGFLQKGELFLQGSLNYPPVN